MDRFLKLEIVRGAVAAGVLLGIGGCTLRSEPFASPEGGGAAAPVEKGAPVTVRQLAEEPAAPVTAIEVLWEVPIDPVDGFVLRYGDHHEALTTEKRLRAEELERRDDAGRGPLYRYVIEGIPSAQPVFLTIAAFKGETVSPPSRVFEVAPGRGADIP